MQTRVLYDPDRTTQDLIMTKGLSETDPCLLLPFYLVPVLLYPNQHDSFRLTQQAFRFTKETQVPFPSQGEPLGLPATCRFRNESETLLPFMFPVCASVLAKPSWVGAKLDAKAASCSWRPTVHRPCGLLPSVTTQEMALEDPTDLFLLLERCGIMV